MSPSHNTSPQEETQVDKFRQELLHTRNEYVKLYNMYVEEHEARCRLETENKELIESLAKVEQSVENVKAIRSENKSLKEKLESRSLEFKHLKSDLENINKEKNILAVALKTSKAEIKDQRKGFEKKSSELEKKVVELNDFKKNKLAEERELQRKNRKEIKKANQKMKKEKEKKDSAEVNPIKKDPDPKLAEDPVLEIKVPSDENDIVEQKPDLNHNLSADRNPKPGQPQSVEEPEPKLMSEEEKEAFFKEIYAKVDKALENMYPGYSEKSQKNQ